MELFFNLATRKYTGGGLHESVERMIEFCESQMDVERDSQQREQRACREEQRISDIENIYVSSMQARRYRPEYYMDYRLARS